MDDYMDESRWESGVCVMREVLYRGKVHESEPMDHPILTPGDWVYGGSVVIGGQPYILCESGLNDVVCSTGGVELVHVVPETVGQYTGLTDTDGTRIFEGDVVSFSDDEYSKSSGSVVSVDRTGEIVFEGCAFMILSDDRYFALSGSAVKSYGVRVIGNIHEDPDMLSN